MAYELVAGSFELRDLAERLRRLEELLALAPGEPLQAMVVAAKDDIPGASAVSITTVHQGKFVTEAASGPRAVKADQLQYMLRSGPCVDAVVNDPIYNPQDLAHDPRWPQFGPRVSTEVGFNSSLSYRLAPDLIIDATTPATSTPADHVKPSDASAAAVEVSGKTVGEFPRPAPPVRDAQQAGWAPQQP